MPRSADELLGNIYRRSRQIRTRRLAARITAGSAAIAIFFGALVVTQLGSGGLVPRTRNEARANEPGSIDGPRAPRPKSVPGPCSCTARPKRQQGPVPLPDPGPQPPPPQQRAPLKLALASNRSGNFEIYTMQADGSRVRRLTNTPAQERDPEWSPDGRHIAFVRMDDVTDGLGTIHTMNADGSNERMVARGLAPKWSPDGTRIAYHTHPIIYGEQIGGVWIVRADGSGRRLVAQDSGDPSWTPDGTRLIVGARISGVVNVFSVSLDGRTRKQLSEDPAYACEPDVSPDGSTIAYVSSLPTRLFTMAIDGSGEQRVTNASDWEFAPSWSPDGALIAFQRDPDSDLHYMGALSLGAGPAPSRIVIARSNGSGEVTLPAGDYSDADPAFAPASR